ncbi:autotransporter outer membrane beta-barrel domain-containing protein [Marinibacterium profundimaris]|uniref:Autotransporter domain-containing protein n=1 Tax=Marinibacterium profundimaris TaxID=1679460 RepID=A0A225NTQ5_9RHOB|nr:autotransporter outer membrane beta-barrel domain-containing protein [Marinibacterium profundimaris]OWU74980.1 hypothetical protein ATO3_10580 [Marinibacterium profundimaris]
MTKDSSSKTAAPLSVLAVLLSTTAMSPALADCVNTGNNTVLSCTGNVEAITLDYGSDASANPDIENLTKVEVSDLSADMTDAQGNSAYIRLEAQVAAGPTEIDVTLDNGHDMKSDAGILEAIVTAQSGSEGEENYGRDSRTGPNGGDGTDGQGLSFSAKGDKGATLGGESHAGINVVYTAGTGGQGGEGHAWGGTGNTGTGGVGGRGGNAGEIDINIDSDVVLNVDTTDGGPGVYIVSSGGTGGLGGTGRSNGADSGYGGVGGKGGTGGKVTFSATNSSNRISATKGHGIVAISQAGDGGQGGKSIAMYDYPGAGGNGGAGGDVSVDYHGAVETKADNNIGIFAQSVSGAGGVEGEMSGGKATHHPAAPSNPGSAGTVEVDTTDADVSTSGHSSFGVVAHSVGGHGGNGPNSDGLSAYGASGSSGGDGGQASVTMTGSEVTTQGDSAIGVISASVGGGGGSGGSASGLTALGGEGAVGGNADAAQASLTDTTITTAGDRAEGITVLSVGGGGGNSGDADGLVASGASAGNGGNGSTAALTVSGSTIATTGYESAGVVVASVGGGGGNSHSGSGLETMGATGGNGGDAGNVTYSSEADSDGKGTSVSTKQDKSEGIALLSVGHGGGKSGSTHKVSLVGGNQMGASGSGGGHGGDISFTMADGDSVSTEGHLSEGVFALSLGGGGGKSGSVTTIDVVNGGTAATQSMGATGGKASDGGDITKSKLAGEITTKGDASAGALVVSAGGGGGVAGNQTTVTAAVSLNNNVGADGGPGGNGGEVSFTSSAAITTSGHLSEGIVAASVGGGGGHSSNVQNVSIGANVSDLTISGGVGAQGGSAGNGGAVTVTLDDKSDIKTKGEAAGGLVALSVGGSGGNAGSVISSNIGALNLSVNTGASGSAGGTGGDVTVTNQGKINTAGQLAPGIFAGSVGGGGGRAATSVDGSISAIGISMNFGGANGDGGEAGTVSVTHDGQITTAGHMSSGILAASVGGGGGSGGVAVSGTGGIVSADMSMGASGGAGGTAQTVTVTSSGDVSTGGVKAPAIAGLSVGGKGGTGGLAVSGSGDAGPISGSLSLAVGGGGGGGGTAGDVNLTTTGGTIQTTQQAGIGLLGLSVGGHGGSGGMVVAGNVDASEEGSGSFTLAVGGDGGDGGTGGKVDIKNAATINTSGHYGFGILAASVGGHGGDGGSSYSASATVTKGTDLEASVNVGGGGASGGTGGDITVDNTGNITTTGGNAHAIYMNSIGGSGGSGGSGVSYLVDFGTTENSQASFHGNVHVGGKGGSGNTGGKVTASNSAKLSTAQDTSYGIFAHSIGGNGGDGGNAGAFTVGYTWESEAQKKDPLELNYNFSIGGGGGGGGTGGDVSVTNDQGGRIETGGVASYGMFGQSIGGDGGTGGNGEPDAKGWVADIYNVYEDVNTIHEQYEQFKKAKKSIASLLTNFSVSVGGNAGAASTGGDVTLKNSGSIVTTGNSATGMYAQSTGGGGGVAGDGSEGLLTSVAVAGSTGGGGDSGAITLTNDGSITTSGSGAMGIYAQALGGGGGTAGDIEGSIISAFTDLAQSVGAQVFGKANGGDGGSGGNITMTMGSGSSIKTTGDKAHGIWLQSTGGGGGAQGQVTIEGGDDDDGQQPASTPAYIGSSGNPGNGGFIDIDMAGDITVTGYGSHGIFAQSASGGDDSSGSGGIRLNVSGNITAEGASGRGILVQADGVADNLAKSGTCAKNSATCAGTAHVSIAEGAIVHTSDEDAYETIGFMSGQQSTRSDGTIFVSNLLENAGTVSTAKPYRTAVGADGTASLRIHNLSGGLISGSVVLTGDPDTFKTGHRMEFENRSGARFEPGEYVNLGDHGNYTGEAGSTIAPYGSAIGMSIFALGEEYSESGTYEVTMAQVTNVYDMQDVGADLIRFASDSYSSFAFSPTVVPTWTKMPTDHSLNSGQELIADGHDFSKSGATVENTATVTYDLEGTYSDLRLNYSIDLSGASNGVELNRNGQEYASYFTRALGAAGAEPTQEGTAANDLATLGADYLNAATGEELQQRYSHHVPDEAVIGVSGAVLSTLRLNDLLQSCPTLDPSAGLAFLRQTECTWVQATGGKRHQDATDESPQYDSTAYGLAIGSQHQIGADLFLEIAGQAETLSIGGENFSQDGERYSFGVALKKEVGRYTFSSTLAGGIYGLDYERGYTVSGVRHQAKSDIDGRYLGAELRATAVYEGQGGFYAKPSAALAYTQVWQDGFTEDGTGPQAWEVGSVSDSWLTFTPQIELGRAFAVGDRASLAFVRAGMTVALNDPTTSVGSLLVGTDASAGQMTSVLGKDRYQGDLTAGFEVMLQENLSVSVLGQTSLSENSHDYGGTARIEFRF